MPILDIESIAIVASFAAHGAKINIIGERACYARDSIKEWLVAGASSQLRVESGNSANKVINGHHIAVHLSGQNFLAFVTNGVKSKFGWAVLALQNVKIEIARQQALNAGTASEERMVSWAGSHILISLIHFGRRSPVIILGLGCYC